MTVSGISTQYLIELLAFLATAGALAGFLSGLLGIGGGGVLVPVLYEVFGAAGVSEDIRMHVTLGTTLGVIAPTVFRSFSAFRARGTVDIDVVKRMGPWIFLGVVAGIVIASYASSEFLRWIWVFFGTALALKMFLGRDDWKISSVLPRPPWLEMAAFVIGLISTLMGIGGATFTVPLLTLHGMTLLRAVGTATGIGAVIAIPGLAGYIISGWGEHGLPPLSVGYVNLGALVVAPIAVLAAPYGVKLAHVLSKRTLELAFAVFITTVVARFLWTLLA
ncbi:sulfite exporter TauE/SafE family protein [Hyphomicrobium sp.]|uniref:sulfite exporter TauE/SafE family protein n=1 Tax=Hyphomicrobium sp. TaxID=82 RepID=UPI000FC0458C|nr:sulfite exporter TauE/SafE family protein [Hyphomicrobium sp.]RUO99149.1 MAG: sulfite exporter TauE/SafE family protein [Hyphomicrobium sp.]